MNSYSKDRRHTTLGLLLAVAVAVVVFVSGCGTLHEACVNWKYPRDGQVVEVEGTPTVVLRWKPAGDSSKGDMVFVGGNQSFAREGEQVLTNLASQGYRGLSYDRPGNGHTPALPEQSVEGQIAHLHELLAREEITSPILIGHSWSGALAMMYASRYPVRGLVLLSPVVEPDETLQNGFSKLYLCPVIGPLVAESFGPIFSIPFVSIEVNKAIAGPLDKRDERLRAYRRKATALFSRQSSIRALIRDDISMYHALEHFWEDTNVIARLTNIPITVLYGRLDETVTPLCHSLRLTNHLSHVEVFKVDGAGHEIAVTHPDAATNAVMFTLEWIQNGLGKKPDPARYRLTQ